MIDLMTVFTKVVLVSIVLVSVMNVMVMAVYEQYPRDRHHGSHRHAAVTHPVAVRRSRRTAAGVIGTLLGILLGLAAIEGIAAGNRIARSGLLQLRAPVRSGSAIWRTLLRAAAGDHLRPDPMRRHAQLRISQNEPFDILNPRAVDHI